MLPKGKSGGEIKRHLDTRKLRGHSGKLFIKRDIRMKPKRLCTGMIETPSGGRTGPRK
jgi:hypothetical protein